MERLFLFTKVPVLIHKTSVLIKPQSLFIKHLGIIQIPRGRGGVSRNPKTVTVDFLLRILYRPVTIGGEGLGFFAVTWFLDDPLCFTVLFMSK